MNSAIRVAIFDDHQGIVDGYLYRFSQASDIQVVGIAMFGNDLGPLLARTPMDLLIMDIYVPKSADDRGLLQVNYLVPELRKKYPDVRILVISAVEDRVLIELLIGLGISGFIPKGDQDAIQNLADIVRRVAAGASYFGKDVFPVRGGSISGPPAAHLTVKELEVLSICASYPEKPTSQIALDLGVAHSTVRNQLSACYEKLNAHTRAAAISKAQTLGLFQKPKDLNEPL